MRLYVRVMVNPLAGLAAWLAGALPALGEEVPFIEHVISTTAGAAFSVFAADLDGDGDIDVLSASGRDDKIAWHESDGGSPPTFTERVISTNANAAQSVFAMDLDGDGDTDVLSASALDDKIAWYENDGGLPPTFTERVISTTAEGAISVFAADVDGDGDPDVLSASNADDKIAWYQSDGGAPPNFTERVISTNGNGPTSVFAMDLDGDGDTDVLSASQHDDKIAWYENNGGSPPTFTERVISTTADLAFSVFATDLDDDGDTDVLSASGFDDKIAWYENNGGSPPTFSERVISTAANGALSVFATDVDGDGDTDVLSGSQLDDTIAWYESDGGSPPTFIERVISTTADGPFSVFAMDLDGDGDIDVLSASRDDDKIAWYEHGCSADSECDDGNDCTDNVCESGVCTNPNLEGTPCGDQTDDDCTNPNTCDGAGNCVDNHATDGTACTDDDNDCTDDVCDGLGNCAHPNLTVATPCGDPSNSVCTDPDTCDGLGSCQPNDEAAGTFCGDSSNTVCTDPDTCDGAGACLDNHETDGTACTDDGNSCTNDVCDADGNCLHPSVSDPDCCPVENECCVDDDCNDDDPCTTDSCVSAACDHAAVIPCCGDGDCDAQAEDVCSCPDDCGSPSRTESGAGCNDGLDNDCDGVIDGDDPDCDVECTDDDDCDDGDPCTGNDCEDGQCQNPLIECADGETCVDGACVVVWEIQVFVSPGEAATRELTSQDAHADGSGVEIPVPDAPVIDGVTLMFVLWEGDVPTGQETADPLILIADADKTVTAVFQQLPEVPGGAACGACGAGSGVSMIMVLFGWVGLRLVGSRRVRGKTETPGR